MNSPEKPKIFISYRSKSGLDEAEYFEAKFSDLGIPVLRVRPSVQSPYPEGSIEEFDWFREALDKVTFGIPHVLIIASADASSSLWIGREILSSFAHARTLFIYWISGEDPRRWIAALPRVAYRFFPGSTAFLIDAREIVSAKPVLRIAFPNLKMRICAAILWFAYLMLGGLLFAIFARAIQAAGFPAEQTWRSVLAALLTMMCVVAVFPRRVVLAYKLSKAELSGTQLVYAGQSGTGIVLMVAGTMATLLVLVVASFHIFPTSEHISYLGVVYLFLQGLGISLYKTLIALPVSRVNANALMRGARQTAQRIDANRKASSSDTDAPRPS